MTVDRIVVKATNEDRDLFMLHLNCIMLNIVRQYFSVVLFNTKLSEIYNFNNFFTERRWMNPLVSPLWISI